MIKIQIILDNISIQKIWKINFTFNLVLISILIIIFINRIWVKRDYFIFYTECINETKKKIIKILCNIKASVVKNHK